MSKKGYIVVQEWMIAELPLKGNDLMLFALIYGFSQGGGEYYGTLKYSSEVMKCSKSTIQRSLKNLLEKGFISRFERENDMGMTPVYKTLVIKKSVNLESSKPLVPLVKMTAPPSQNEYGGVFNLNSNIINNNNKNKTLSAGDENFLIHPLFFRKKIRNIPKDSDFDFIENSDLKKSFKKLFDYWSGEYQGSPELAYSHYIVQSTYTELKRKSTEWQVSEFEIIEFTISSRLNKLPQYPLKGSNFGSNKQNTVIQQNVGVTKKEPVKPVILNEKEDLLKAVREYNNYTTDSSGADFSDSIKKIMMFEILHVAKSVRGFEKMSIDELLSLA